MPKLTNKKTGQVYTVTARQLAEMEKKPHLMKAFKVERTTEPEELKQLRASKANQNNNP